MSENTPAIFNGSEITITDHNGQPWLTTSEISKALGYSRDDSVNKIYERNKEEFDDSMTCYVKMTLQGQNREVRIFSKRGCHLIGMFAKTDLAKQFRVWVLNTLDHGIGQATPISEETPRITAKQLAELKDAIYQGMQPFHFRSKACHRVNNTIRFMLNISNIDQIHPDDYDKALAIVEQSKATATAYWELRLEQETEIIEDIIGRGFPFTPALRARMRKEKRLKLPQNPNWQQVTETLDQPLLEKPA